MKIANLLRELSLRGLSLRRKSDETLVIVGDTKTLTADLKAALAEHKSTLLQTITGAPVLKPEGRPQWWADHLSDEENQAIDDFMGYDTNGQVTDWHSVLYAPGPCPKCGVDFWWWDAMGQYCRICNPPDKAMAIQAIAQRLMQTAAERLANPKVPMLGRRRPYKGRKQRQQFATEARPGRATATPPPSQCAPGECRRVDLRVSSRTPNAKDDPQGSWIRTACSICGRFFGYRPAGKSEGVIPRMKTRSTSASPGTATPASATGQSENIVVTLAAGMGSPSGRAKPTPGPSERRPNHAIRDDQRTADATTTSHN